MKKQIQFEGAAWSLLGVGVEHEGQTFCHLGSTTQFNEQRNGRVPVQINVWVGTDVVHNAQEA
jgi:hypothetical protein